MYHLYNSYTPHFLSHLTPTRLPALSSILDHFLSARSLGILNVSCEKCTLTALKLVCRKCSFLMFSRILIRLLLCFRNLGWTARASDVPDLPASAPRPTTCRISHVRRPLKLLRLKDRLSVDLEASASPLAQLVAVERYTALEILRPL